jgi:hypothetical protein
VKDCGVVIRALASQIGDLGSNLISAKIFTRLVELGPQKILHLCTDVKAGHGDSKPDKGVELLIHNTKMLGKTYYAI